MPHKEADKLRAGWQQAGNGKIGLSHCRDEGIGSTPKASTQSSQQTQYPHVNVLRLYLADKAARKLVSTSTQQPFSTFKFRSLSYCKCKHLKQQAQQVRASGLNYSHTSKAAAAETSRNVERSCLWVDLLTETHNEWTVRFAATTYLMNRVCIHNQYYANRWMYDMLSFAKLVSMVYIRYILVNHTFSSQKGAMNRSLCSALARSEIQIIAAAVSKNNSRWDLSGRRDTIVSQTRCQIEDNISLVYAYWSWWL